MRITSVELVPAGSSDICEMSFRDPRRQNPFNVKQIAGLDADDISARFYGASIDSSKKFYALSIQKREIVARVELNPSYSENETYSDLRDRLYKMISSSRTGIVWLNFKNDEDSIAAVSGFVKKLEASHFSKNPEVQITIECDDPMLKALEPVVVDVSGLDPDLTNIQDPLSTAPHGFTFEMEFTAASPLFVMADQTYPDWYFGIEPAGGFLTGDILHFSSEHNNKYLFMDRDSTIIHLADVIMEKSSWPIMFPGDNEFVCPGLDDREWVSISYYPTYWGV